MSSSLHDGVFNFIVREALADIDERRVSRRRTSALISVTDAALVVVDALTGAAASRLVFGRKIDAGGFVCVYINDAVARIDGGAAPLSAAEKAGKHDGFFVETGGNELATTEIGAESFLCPLVRRGRALRQQIFCQNLTRERRRSNRHRLGMGGDFAGNLTGWKRTLSNREKRTTSGAIEEKQISLLCGLGDCVDLLSVALDCDERGRRGKSRSQIS